MRKLILLMKSGKIKIIKEKSFEYSSKIKYVLIPIESYDSNTYILLKANPIMDFESVKLHVVLNYIWDDDYNDESYNKEFACINKEYTSIVELYNMIHSIYRIKFVNNVMSYSTDFENINAIVPTQFDIDFLLKDKSHYRKSFNSKINAVLDDSGAEILSLITSIKDFYNSADKELHNSDNVVINQYTNTWEFTSKISDANCIYGLRLHDTASIYFVPYDIVSILDNINSSVFKKHVIADNRVMSRPNIINGEIINDEILNYRDNLNSDKTHYIEYEITPDYKGVNIDDYELYDEFIYGAKRPINDTLEKIIYDRMLSMLIVLVYDKFVFDGEYGSDYFNIITQITVSNSYRKKNIDYTYDIQNSPSIIDFFKRMINEWGE